MKRNVLNLNKSNSNAPNLNTDLHLPPTHSNQNSTQESNTPNASNQHLDVMRMPPTHPVHVSQSSHLSEMSTFSSSYREQNKYSFKKLKKCFNSLKIIKSLDNDWNFFPVSFLFYVLILLSLTLILSIRYKHSYSLAHTTCSVDAPLIHSTHIIDWMVLYSLLLLNIWESLLNFYRFWTTRQCSMLITNDSNSTLYLYYALYALFFLIICIVQFHWCYWLFPLLILCHISFNAFCIIRFSHILLQQYNTLSRPEHKASVIVNDNMLSSVRIMMICSLLSAMMNSLLFSFIVSCYAIHIIIYLPLIHSLSSFIFSFNFVRNRASIHQCITQIQSVPIVGGHPNNNNTDTMHPSAMPTRQPPNTPERSLSNHEAACAIQVSTHVQDDNVMMPPSQQTNIIPIAADAENENDIEPLSSATASSSLATVNILAACDITTPAKTDVTAPAYISLTPLFKPAANPSNTHGGTSRSEPSTPFITNEQTPKEQKQMNLLSKTPQLSFAARFSPSPGLLSLNPKHWVKTLSLNLGLTAQSAEDDKLYSMVRRKKRCQSEQNISQLVTHSLSFDEQQDHMEQRLNIFGMNRSLPSQTAEPAQTCTEDIKTNHEEEDTMVMGLDVRLDNDALILSADLAQEVEINENTHREVVPFQKWDAFGAAFPSEEPRLQISTSDKHESQRNCKPPLQSESRRACSMNTIEIARAAQAIQFELTMQNIEEDEVNYDLPEMKMLQLMVQHGFYSKNAFNSVQQIKKYDFPSSL